MGVIVEFIIWEDGDDDEDEDDDGILRSVSVLIRGGGACLGEHLGVSFVSRADGTVARDWVACSSLRPLFNSRRPLVLSGLTTLDESLPLQSSIVCFGGGRWRQAVGRAA